MALFPICPACGYDLRGMPEGTTRCSECGTTVGRGGIAPQIPWVHRRVRGRWNSYWLTVSMVIFRPSRIGAEASRPMSLRAAKRFHRLSLFLATIILTASLAVAFWNRGHWWGNAVNQPKMYKWGDGGTFGLWPAPFYALLDTYWILLPAGISVYGIFAASMAAYRWAFTAGRRQLRARRRSLRVAYYGSGLLIAEALLLGIFAMVGSAILEEARPWSINNVAIDIWAGIILGAMVAVCIPTIPLMAVGAHARQIRRAAFFMMFPILQVLLATIIGAEVFWVIGYLAMAWCSMLR